MLHSGNRPGSKRVESYNLMAGSVQRQFSIANSFEGMLTSEELEFLRSTKDPIGILQWFRDKGRPTRWQFASSGLENLSLSWDLDWQLWR